MNNIGKNFRDIRYLDTMASGDSPLHRVDPRAKLITTLLFIVAVISFDRYTLLGFIPFFLYPIVLISAGGLPAGYFFKKVLLVSPFAVMIGIFNPIVDREIISHIGSIGISGGWISFLSILLRFLLTVSAALILIALTGFNAVCKALTKFGVPRVFVVQLLFFYRYIFVLVDEAEKMEMARSLRSFNSKARPFKVFISIIGHLLLRSFDRAERIYLAMRCRGFDGNIHLIRKIKAGWKDLAFVAGWTLLFATFRMNNIPIRLGEYVMEALK
jgi:cobalt/nickel transport system permease protein